MKTVIRVRLAPNLVFHAPVGSILHQMARAWGTENRLNLDDFKAFCSEVPFCNNPDHVSGSFGCHTATLHASGANVAIPFPEDTSQCYVEPKP